MKLCDLVSRKAIVASLPADDRNGVIRDLVQALADAGQLEADQVDSIVRSIITRERTRGHDRLWQGSGGTAREG